MRLNQTEKILTILASLTAIVGGSIGIYQMLTRDKAAEANTGNPPVAQALPNVEQVALDLKPTPSESEKAAPVSPGGLSVVPKSDPPVKPAPEKKSDPVEPEVIPPAPENLVKPEPQPMPIVPEKPVEPVLPDYVYFEDFSKVKPGLLPEGWTGDNAVVVMHSGGKSHLKINGNDEPYTVTTPKILPEGNFAVEWEASIGRALRNMNVVLQGSKGQQVTVLAAHYGGGHDDLYVKLEDSPQTSIKPRQSTGSTARFRLVREGEVFHLLVNGESIHVVRLPGYGDFHSIRFELPGAEGTKLFSVKVFKL